MDEPDNNIVYIHDLNFSYENIHIFKDLNLKVEIGKKIGIYGPSGSGKTSLLLILANKKKNYDGSVKISAKSRMIYQYPQLNPYLTCIELLEMEKQLNNSNLDYYDYLRKAGLSDLQERLVVQLSGGEKQRLSLMCALLSGSDLILADEPFGRLDYKNALKLNKFLFDIVTSESLTIIMASHYLKHFENFDEIYELKNKNLVLRSL